MGRLTLVSLSLKLSFPGSGSDERPPYLASLDGRRGASGPLTLFPFGSPRALALLSLGQDNFSIDSSSPYLISSAGLGERLSSRM